MHDIPFILCCGLIKKKDVCLVFNGASLVKRLQGDTKGMGMVIDSLPCAHIATFVSMMQRPGCLGHNESWREHRCRW